MTIALQLPRLVFGPGSIEALSIELDSLRVERPLLVTDQGLVKAGLVDRVRAALGRESALFDNVTENPVYADADHAAALFKAEGCDGVIALGGGSVIDTAKCVAALATLGGEISALVAQPTLVNRPVSPLVVIPTTAGTGSEASASAGIHPTSDVPSLGLNARFLIPRVAVLDPDLTASLPARLTAATGIDAMSHCIEGYLSKNDVPLGETLALDGLRRAVAHVRRATTDRQDVEARGQMMLAAFAGGASIQMGLGPAHAIAISCSDQGFHHGILSGIGLVASLDHAVAEEPARAAALREAMGVVPGSSLSRAIAALMRELGLPATLGELGYRVADIDSLAAKAHASYFNRATRHPPTLEAYARMVGDSLQRTPSP